MRESDIRIHPDYCADVADCHRSSQCARPRYRILIHTYASPGDNDAFCDNGTREGWRLTEGLTDFEDSKPAFRAICKKLKTKK